MRFETAIPIGEGASAEVYRAVDPERHVEVALKVLRRADPETLARIEREVGNQCQLEHPSICSILAVEELEGRPCVVMPFIDGRPLDQVIAGRSLEDRVRLVRDVADALAHAHARGVLHRDVKPGNILVERREAEWHPWLLDFGLARHVDDTTLTIGGQALGTPGYMAPEQARGEQDLDTRCDVYGLGAVLFEVLTGRRPHVGSTTAELLVATVSNDAPDPRRFAPELPPALAAIVARCLERDRRFRYGDAGALRNDLDAWLAGRSVAASRGRWARLLRRRNVRRAVAGIASLAIVVALGVYYALDRRMASERAAGFATEAQRYATVAAELEGRLRLVFARPLHDVRDDVERIELELADLDAQGENASVPARAATRYALGRAWLALGRPVKAVAHFDEARRLGLDDADVALHRGLALIERYGREILTVRRQPDPDFRAAREAQFVEAFLEPGLAALDQALESATASDPRILARALRLRHREGIEPALSWLAANTNAMAWPMPAYLLSARLRFETAAELALAKSAAEAALLLEQAARDSEAAIAQSRSHPAAHRLRCRLAASRTELVMQGHEPEGPIDLDSCDALLVIDATDAENLTIAGEAYERRAAWSLQRSAPVRADVERAVQLADSALTQDPALAAAWRLQAAARFTAARDALLNGDEHGPLLQQAASDMEQAIALDSGVVGWYIEFANILTWSARERYTRGLSGDEDYARAVEVLERASTLPDVGASTRIELPSLLTWRGYHRFVAGQLADDILEKALIEARQAAADYPDLVAARIVHALAAWTVAEYRLLVNRDAGPIATEAVEAYELAAELDPDRFSLQYNRIGCYYTHIISLQRKGLDATAELERAGQLLAQARDAFPDDRGLDFQAAGLDRMRGVEAIRLGEDPTGHFVAARELLAAAEGMTLDAIERAITHGFLANDEIAWRIATDRFDPALFRADRERLNRAIATLPDIPRIRGLRAEFLARAGSAGVTTETGESPEQLLAAARRDLAKAIEGNEALVAYYAPLRASVGVP